MAGFKECPIGNMRLLRIPTVKILFILSYSRIRYGVGPFLDMNISTDNEGERNDLLCYRTASNCLRRCFVLPDCTNICMGAISSCNSGTSSSLILSMYPLPCSHRFSTFRQQIGVTPRNTRFPSEQIGFPTSPTLQTTPSMISCLAVATHKNLTNLATAPKGPRGQACRSI